MLRSGIFAFQCLGRLTLHGFCDASQTYKYGHFAWPERREEGATASSFDKEQIAHTLFKPTRVPRLPSRVGSWRSLQEDVSLPHGEACAREGSRAAPARERKRLVLACTIDVATTGQDACPAACGVDFDFTRKRTATMPSS